VSKRINYRLGKRIRKERGEVCAICGTNRKIKAHHIVPRRNGGLNSRNNIILLCHAHHKLADRIQDNEFRSFEILAQPKNQEELIEFIRLIEKNQAGSKKTFAKRKYYFSEATPGFPSPREFFSWCKKQRASLNI